jgi:ABC-type uncharacterized transport system ATPase subunit
LAVNVELCGISKRFQDNIANDRVDFDLRSGEIHALLGENGAGKTTLMNILYGLYQPDEGTIRVNGETVNVNSPADAIRLGIGMVHQHFMLIPPLTVVENVILGLPSSRGVFLDVELASKRIREISDKYRLAVDPGMPVMYLTVGAEQRVEILKALYRNVRILILDEPTAVLTPNEIEELFRVFRSLAAAGCSIIFITHKLSEVMELAQRVTVMRRGKRIATMMTSSTTRERLAAIMFGDDTELELKSDRPASTQQQPVLEVDDLWVQSERGTDAIRGLSLTVHEGEIVGIAGVEGNGQAELGWALAGISVYTRGRIAVNGRELAGRAPKSFIEAGIAYLSEDRHRFGLVVEFSIAENTVLNRLDQPRFHSGPFLRPRAIEAEARRLINSYDIRTPSEQTQVRTLSGGNQQKLMLARETARDPALYVACQPTRGLDLAATRHVHRVLVAERNRGKAIVLVSTELEELFALSDRIAVLYRGQITGFVTRGEPDANDKIARMMTGVAGVGRTAS